MSTKRNTKPGAADSSKPRFSAIPKLPRAYYENPVPWRGVDKTLEDMRAEALAPFVMEPDFQRGHVWTEAQQVAFVEYGLMGGESSMVLTTNCPGWMGDFRGPWVLVDGLQRLTAVLRFVRGEIPAFGHRVGEYGDRIHSDVVFRLRVCELPTRAEVLKLYLLMNAGGVVHSPEEIARVRGLLEKETR